MPFARVFTPLNTCNLFRALFISIKHRRLTVFDFVALADVVRVYIPDLCGNFLFFLSSQRSHRYLVRVTPSGRALCMRVAATGYCTVPLSMSSLTTCCSATALSMRIVAACCGVLSLGYSVLSSCSAATNRQRVCVYRCITLPVGLENAAVSVVFVRHRRNGRNINTNRLASLSGSYRHGCVNNKQRTGVCPVHTFHGQPVLTRGQLSERNCQLITFDRIMTRTCQFGRQYLRACYVRRYELNFQRVQNLCGYRSARFLSRKACLSQQRQKGNDEHL